MGVLFQTQAVYRVLLDVMSRPGTVKTLPDTIMSHWDGGMLAIAATLVDHEVGFCALGDDKLSGKIEDLTHGRRVEFEQADFIFIPGGDSRGRVNRAKSGLPELPDMGATIIYQAEQLAVSGGEGTITLSGPGIEHTIQPSILGVPQEELLCLTEINSQYPLGIDVLLVDLENKIMAIPRSVQVQPAGADEVTP